MKKQESYIEVNNDDFKSFKKQKKNFIIQLNDEDNKKMTMGDKINIVDAQTNKKVKKKIKNIECYSNPPDLIDDIKKYDNLNYEDSTKDFSKEDIKKYGLSVIELKKEKHIVKKVLLGIILLLLLFFGYKFISRKLNTISAKRFNDSLTEFSKERVDYVFVEINPSFVLTVKDGETQDIACLNDDCMSIYDELNIKGKDLTGSIETIYNVSKEKGFDTSKGVKVQTTSALTIESKDYVTVERIDNDKEKELLKSIKNNDEIVDVSNDDYYDKLWNKLKSDSEYDKTFSCAMDEDELKCFITEKFVEASEENNNNGLTIEGFMHTLGIFGIEYETYFWSIGASPYGLYLNGELYYMVNRELVNYGDVPECEKYKSGMPTGYVACGLTYSENITEMPFNRLNLLKSQFDSKNLYNLH